VAHSSPTSTRKGAKTWSQASTEHKVPSVVLGQGLPAAALARAMVTRQPAAVFLWASLRQPADAQAPWRTGLRGSCRIVLGGPGWDGVPLGGSGGVEVERATDMADAVTRIERAL
jgi:hypothetical protein